MAELTAAEIQLCICGEGDNSARCRRHIELVQQQIAKAVQAEREARMAALSDGGLREAVYELARSPTLQSCGLRERDYDGCFVSDLLRQLRDILAAHPVPAPDPAETCSYVFPDGLRCRLSAEVHEMPGMEHHAEADVLTEDTARHRCTCGHRPIWHHDERGCGYLGNGPHGCPCSLSSDDVLDEAVQAERDRALRIADAIKAGTADFMQAWEQAGSGMSTRMSGETAAVVVQLRAEFEGYFRAFARGEGS